jgi:hypothetical protein
MTNYDMDELERRNLLVQHHQERERKSRGIRPEDEDHSVEIELSQKDILKLALLAHEKDVTLNTICIDILKQGIKDGEYRFEHDKRPQLLNETE